jgi:hypothetical protein
MGRRRLVTRHNEPDAQFLAKPLERFKHHHVCSIRNCMDKTHTFCVQTPDQKFTTGYFTHISSPVGFGTLVD